MADKRKDIHGNMAKVDPKNGIQSMYAPNTPGISDRKEHTPVVNDESVAPAKNFFTDKKK